MGQTPGITLGGQFWHPANRVVAILAPQCAQQPTPAQVLGCLTAPTPPLAAYHNDTRRPPLLARPPTAPKPRVAGRHCWPGR